MEADTKTEQFIPKPGELWAYRKRDDAPSEQVLIINVVRDKHKVRVEIKFVDGANAGQIQSVSGSRLPILWRDVEAYDCLMANWQRLDAEGIDEVEEFACDVVYERLIPSGIAEVFTGGRAKNGLEAKDISALEVLMGRPMSDMKGRNAWFELDAILILSPTGGLDVAAAACEENPDPILEYVMAEEAKVRHYCKHGRKDEGRRGQEDRSTSPEWEYHYYLKDIQPVHELLRQWCGHRSVTAHERLVAAEAETRRLDLLLSHAIDVLRDSNKSMFAAHLEEEHERERILPHRVRAVPDRPLEQSEIPVIRVPTRRRWGW
ncbi:hypothetical protein [Arthrobacter sp. HLT1-20]